MLRARPWFLFSMRTAHPISCHTGSVLSCFYKGNSSCSAPCENGKPQFCLGELWPYTNTEIRPASRIENSRLRILVTNHHLKSNFLEVLSLNFETSLLQSFLLDVLTISAGVINSLGWKKIRGTKNKRTDRINCTRKHTVIYYNTKFQNYELNWNFMSASLILEQHMKTRQK